MCPRVPRPNFKSTCKEPEPPVVRRSKLKLVHKGPVVPLLSFGIKLDVPKNKSKVGCPNSSLVHEPVSKSSWVSRSITKRDIRIPVGCPNKFQNQVRGLANIKPAGCPKSNRVPEQLRDQAGRSKNTKSSWVPEVQ